MIESIAKLIHNRYKKKLKKRIKPLRKKVFPNSSGFGDAPTTIAKKKGLGGIYDNANIQYLYE